MSYSSELIDPEIDGYSEGFAVESEVEGHRGH